MWTLPEALDYIRSMQAAAMRRNYYIALAGGVLNKGFSCNDLDLVFVPRTAAAREGELIEWLESIFGGPFDAEEVPCALVGKVCENGRQLDIIIIIGEDHA